MLMSLLHATFINKSKCLIRHCDDSAFEFSRMLQARSEFDLIMILSETNNINMSLVEIMTPLSVMHEIKSSIKYSLEKYLSNIKKTFIKIDPVVTEIIASKDLIDPQNIPFEK